MKRSNIFKHMYTGAVLLAICILGSCSKDASYDFNGDETNRVFFNVGNYTVNSYNSFSFLLKQTPAGSVGEISAAFPASTTLETDAAIKVKYTLDNSLIDSYNAQKGTKYSPIPEGLLTMSSAELTIPQGKLASSDSLKISVAADKLSLLTGSGYVIPVTIISISGSSNAQVSTNMKTVYIVVNTVNTNVYDSPLITDMTGTLVANRTTWSATLDATPTSGLLANMFDARTNTNWYLSPAKASVLTVNLGAATSGITGIRIHTSTTTYYLTTANVLTSNDGNTWVSQGQAKFSIVNAYQYVKFYSPVNARYLRLEITGWRTTAATTRIMLTEFDVYKN